MESKSSNIWKIITNNNNIILKYFNIIDNMPRTNKVKSNNTEGFKEGWGFLKKVVKSVTKSVTNVFLKPLKALKDKVLKKIRDIEGFIRAILCFALYLQLIFSWCSNTVLTITKYFLATPKCFVIWVLDSLVQFFQYIIIDILLNLVLKPPVYIGKALNHPFVEDIQITSEVRKKLYENTNLVRLSIRMIDSKLDIGWKIQPDCFGIGAIAPFPKYYS
jgi:hypothetical protein